MITILKKISDDEACSILMEKPEKLKVVNISDVKASTRKDNQYYMYVDFEMEDGTQLGVSYSFYKENDLFKCGTSSKLYYLMKGFLDLNPLTCVGLTFTKSDIDEVLQDKKFIASAVVESVGGKNYPYIICEKVIE